ncbi:MAG: chloride channel protein [Deltaproteobacteria bacterium]|nr:MAG: chloride channel protein [Deltaproteobacteria bacterium]
MPGPRRWTNFINYLREHAISRWMFYSLLIGIVAGLGAAAFFFSLEWLKYFVLDFLAGYPMESPAGERLIHGMPHGIPNTWILFLAPAVGGLISGLVVYSWAPEAEGHGTDAMIDAFHNKQGEIRTRVPYIKSAASVITLATGGSAGREGPIAQIGAGFGSWLGRVFNLDSRERRILMLAGCAGGLGAIFRAPLGGAITSIEVLYTEDFESEAIIPCVMSSVVAYSIFTFIFGHQPIFETPDLIFNDPRELLPYMVLGLVCVPAGWLYSKSLYGLRDHFFRRIPIKPHFVPAIGGLLVGCIGLMTPKVLSGGYGIIQLALLGKLTVSLMAVMVLTKIFATSFTIGSGGSGGVFGPSLFIGAMLGGVVGKLGHQYFPQVVSNPTAFALVGMAAFFAGVAKAPIGALLMVSEMTRGYGLVVPLMFVSAIPVLLSGRWGIYEKQVKNKFASPAHLTDLTINVLQNMQVRDVYNPHKPVTMLPMDMRLKEMKQLMMRTRESFFPVVDEEIRLVGILSFPDLRAILFEETLSDLIVVGDLVEKPVAIGLNETLYEALIKFISSGYGQIPILKDDRPGRLTGVLSLEELMEAYHQEMVRLEQG